DVSCGNNPRRPKVEICFEGRSLCIPSRAVASFLGRGATLGSCDDTQTDIVVTNLKTYPNPFKNSINVRVESTSESKVDFIIYDFHGRVVYQKTVTVTAGEFDFKLTGLGHLRRGLYYLKPTINGKVQTTKILLKH
ncbi:unnamed protein product, partial [Ectocarpus sp. 4 AP-2014]